MILFIESTRCQLVRYRDSRVELSSLLSINFVCLEPRPSYASQKGYLEHLSRSCGTRTRANRFGLLLTHRAKLFLPAPAVRTLFELRGLVGPDKAFPTDRTLYKYKHFCSVYKNITVIIRVYSGNLNFKHCVIAVGATFFPLINSFGRSRAGQRCFLTAL